MNTEVNREAQVAVFHKLMNQNFSNNPNDVTLKNKQLAIRLIYSELEELAKACGVSGTFQQLASQTLNASAKEDTGVIDQVLQLDGLCDVQYTTSWAVNMLGHSAHFPEAFKEVCRSNNSKACPTIEDAEKTKAYWENSETPEGGEEHYIDEVSIATADSILTCYVVKRQSDGKVRKALTYSPANFEQFIKDLV